MPEITAIDDLTDAPHAEVFEQREPRTVRLELEAGEEVPPHTHPGTNVVLHLLDGRLEVSLDDETYELDSGELARFSGDRAVSPPRSRAKHGDRRPRAGGRGVVAAVEEP